MAPLSGISQTIARAELSAILAALRWASHHQCDICVWSDSKSTVRTINKLLHMAYVPGSLKNRDLWLAVWEELQHCAALRLWIRWIPSHLPMDQSDDSFEDWIIKWNGYADAAAVMANQERTPVFWDLFRRYERELDWWATRLRKLRRFYELVAEQTLDATTTPEAPILVASDSEDEMLAPPRMLEDVLPVNWQLLCRQQSLQIPAEFLVKLLNWWCDVEILGSQYRILSEVEFVFALISDPAFQFPFQLDGTTTWEFRTLSGLFQKPTVAQLMHHVKLALRSISKIFPRFAFEHAPRRDPCIGILTPFRWHAASRGRLQRPSGSGQTPLHHAAPYAHAESARFLLDKGAEINAKDSQGITPLHQASLQGDAEVARLLVDRGADLELKDEEFGATPLHFAAECGHEQMVALLLEKKADCKMLDKTGSTALDLANKSHRTAVVELLAAAR
eukprot:Skav211013  [mRNA]  locus=scaffold134:51708:59003:+ [translate_table: standard]